MASRLDAKFFRKAKKVNRAVELTDTEAFIPAVKDTPEIRVPLPIRRIKTIEERQVEIDNRKDQLQALEETIEVERKSLLALVKSYNTQEGSISEVVSQNLKIKTLMEQRSSLNRPQKWIETLSGLSFKDVFASKRDDRKIGADVYQIKRRSEPITSLYIDLEESEKPVAKPVTIAQTVAPKTTVPIQKTAEEIATGAIIGRRILKKKA
jgi:hypothetical protein